MYLLLCFVVFISRPLCIISLLVAIFVHLAQGGKCFSAIPSLAFNCNSLIVFSVRFKGFQRLLVSSLRLSFFSSSLCFQFLSFQSLCFQFLCFVFQCPGSVLCELYV